MIMKYLIRLTILFCVVCAVVLSGCERHSEVLEKMDLAESLMISQPDSSLVILNALDGETLDEAASARFALLKSMALDKNYIDTTTFDVLQPAIDYYIKKGSPDEKLRTYYYQGRIYQNQGDDDMAMKSFLSATDIKDGISDSLLYANLLVAQGILYNKQYKISNFISNNLQAAKIYGSIGRPLLEIKSYSNALDGEIVLDNKSKADSLIQICSGLIDRYPDGERYFIFPLVSYTIAYGTNNEIATVLDELKGKKVSENIQMNLAYGYAKIGRGLEALDILSNIEIAKNPSDSLKFLTAKTFVLESIGNHEEALKSYKYYVYLLENFHQELFSNELIFADKKHQLEMQTLISIQKRDKFIWGCLCGLFVLIIVIGLVYYQYRIGVSKRIIAEQENLGLRMKQDALVKEKERMELEKRNAELEAENLRLEISRLSNEQAELNELLQKQHEFTQPIQEAIRTRLDILNSLLAKEISSNESYAKPYKKWIESIHKDKNQFMNSTRLAFAASYPTFMEYLKQHDLSEEEINYLCLYAIGLRGKEVGEYIQLKRHYNVSSIIRKKLGIDEHETNIGLYIKRLLKEL